MPPVGTNGRPTKDAGLLLKMSNSKRDNGELIRKQITGGLFSRLIDSSGASSYPPASTLEGLGTDGRGAFTDSCGRTPGSTQAPSRVVPFRAAKVTRPPLRRVFATAGAERPAEKGLVRSQPQVRLDHDESGHLPN